MEVLTDQDIKDELWRFGDKLFYRGGPTDPDYCILKFVATEGRYYSNLHTQTILVP